MKRAGVLVCVAMAAAGCGRQRQPNVPPGEERVFRKRPALEASSGATGGADEIVSPAEAVRRAKVRQLEKLFQDAKSGDDLLNALDKVLRQEIHAPELVPHVARSLSDPDADQRIYAIKARTAISPEDAIADIQLVLRDRDPKVRQAAVESFGLLRDPLPFDAIFTHLQSETEPVVQQAAMMVVAARAPEAEVSRTLDIMRDLDMKAVSPIIELARKYPSVARPRADAIAYFLDRNNADLRLQVAKLLGDWRVRTPAALSGLVRALDDPELAVRKAAFEALRAAANQDFGYDPAAGKDAREAPIGRWRAWAAKAATSEEGGGAESR